MVPGARVGVRGATTIRCGLGLAGAVSVAPLQALTVKQPYEVVDSDAGVRSPTVCCMAERPQRRERDRLGRLLLPLEQRQL
ncbi:hypothetical protein Pcac1_g8377 [Phytophthora cactorum]|uniref:Uncharacterized protein n=1 Tax=Phytophthora cactorum TaxID=29920 RepID=A0A8T1BMW9_9STRA|nr:hypothetical protein Pcac1_g8377 [Phytophthora cactorum]KAG2905234.1 hypothetical protein PC117_g20794 [Phytophthora cactorum]KAG2982953.1 hypothetical protein PC119_g20704 [Phytophthora cactorum]KAG3136641.1 hypothetical protein C6341_g21302 [Phytophthora cactorum]KAG3185036.1 hypothetical protein PC128_g13473 [Phytophthora cactorum]